MAISAELLEILVCPDDHAPVRLVGPAEQPTGLKCERCLRVYPIRDDIPVMLIEEATRDSAAGGNG
ncbi:MAG: Trm112 family protein [Terriglobales bacterium]